MLRLRGECHLLVVPRFQLDIYGRRTYAVAEPTTWNVSENNLREPDMPIDCNVFVIYWRRFFLNSNRRIGRFRGVIFATMRYINWHRHLPLHYVYILHSIFFIATKSVSIIFEYVQSSCMRKIFTNGSMLIVMPIDEQIVASTNFITAIIMFS